MNCKLVITIFIGMLMSGCLMYHRQGMYLSPTNSMVSPYHTIPYRSDSLKSAIYASMLFTTGSGNDGGYDWIRAGGASIYRSHNIGKCLAYYGANLALGKYNLTDFYNSHYTRSPGYLGGVEEPVDTFYHISGNKYSFGNYGLSAGFNGVLTKGRGNGGILAWKRLTEEVLIRMKRIT